MAQISKPAIFVFTFNLDPDFHEGAALADPPHNIDEEHNVTYAFAGEVRCLDLDALQVAIDELAPWYEDALAEHEGEFGVHDWHSGPDNRVICLGGYGSYEVEPDRVLELMHSWHQTLLNATEIEGSFGPVVQIPGEATASDWQAYQAAKSAEDTLD